MPEDHGRTAAQSELLFEREYENLQILRFDCLAEPAASELHVFALENNVHAETAFVHEVPASQRTKMMLARWLQNNEEFLPDETLQAAWNLSLDDLSNRAGHLFHDPKAPAGPRKIMKRPCRF